MSGQPAESHRPAPAEHHIEVRRTARYHTCGDVATAREVWFVLHGHSQLARRFLRHFRVLIAPDRLLVAPEALNRYYHEYAPGYHRPDARVGATWMTREDRLAEIDDYVGYLDSLHTALLATATPPRGPHVLLGFSQGAATAARWAAHGQVRFDHVILWGTLLPAELAPHPALFRGAQLTLVSGRSDGYATPAKLQYESDRLRESGVPHRVIWFDGGHEIDDATLAELARKL